MSSESSSQSRPQIELRCQIDTSMLGLLREFVCSVSRHLGFPDEQITEIEICVDEACANAIEHAYSKSFECGEKNRELLVELSFESNELRIRVIDHGCGTDQNVDRFHELQDYLDSTREKFRGLGFFLINKLMDKVEVQSKPGQGTTVEMTKYRK